MYTIKRELGRLDNIKIGMVRRGRCLAANNNGVHFAGLILNRTAQGHRGRRAYTLAQAAFWRMCNGRRSGIP